MKLLPMFMVCKKGGYKEYLYLKSVPKIEDN